MTLIYILNYFSGKGWCANIYEHSDYSGRNLPSPETDRISLVGTFMNNEASSIKIRDGCTLIGYDDDNFNKFLFALKDDEALNKGDNAGSNNKMTSYSCRCGGKYIRHFQEG